MCLRQRDSYSNSRYFSRHHMQRFINSHPCGQCAECKQMKRNEWYFRNYWQAREAFLDGFHVFESLTYDDLHLPHVSDFFGLDDGEPDFSCVDKEGVQSFFKRLRRDLEYKYFGAYFRIKYFLVSEYGHDDTYADDYGRSHVGTVRPHYHVNFYVMNRHARVSYEVKRLTKRARRFLGYWFQQHRSEFPDSIFFDSESLQFYTFMCGRRVVVTKWLFSHGYLRYGTYEVDFELTPYDFVRMVQEAWDNGNTDNWKARGKGGIPLVHPHAGKDVSRNVFGKGTSRGTDVDLRRITNYISKYVMKNDDYSAMIGARAARVARSLVSDCSTEKEAFQEAFKQVKDKIGLFHLSSEGFGEYFLSPDNIDEDTWQRIEDEGVYMMDDEYKVKVPVHLPMYYMRKLFYRYRTEKQPDGTRRVQWYLAEHGMEPYMRQLYCKIDRLSKKYLDCYVNMPKELQDSVDSILNGRTFHALASYVLVFKGRILYDGYSPTHPLPTVDDIISISRRYDAFDPHMHDYENFGQFLVSREEVDLRPIFGGDYVDVYHRCRKKSRFARQWCINQDTIFGTRRPWRGFDDLVRLFADFRAPKDDDRQRLFDKKVYLENKYKAIGLKVHFKSL